MEITPLGKFVIRTNRVDIETFYDKEKLKYGFVISRIGKDNQNYLSLLNGDFIYNTPREARHEAKGLIRKIRKIKIRE
jgi:hypothetical protein